MHKAEPAQGKRLHKAETCIKLSLHKARKSLLFFLKKNLVNRFFGKLVTFLGLEQNMNEVIFYIDIVSMRDVMAAVGLPDDWRQALKQTRT